MILKFASGIWALFWAGLACAFELGVLNPEQLQALEVQQPLVIDVRTAGEWRDTGVIPGSRELEAFNADGVFYADAWLQAVRKLQTNPEQTVVLVCRSGHRSAVAGRFLAEHGLPHVYHLQNGIQGWIQSGRGLTKP